ncbi:MAG: ParB N-terminal domain-containing protein [Sandaracinaceae bacterium]
MARAKKKTTAAASRGLAPTDLVGDPPPEVAALAAQIEADGGSVLARYRDPIGGHWQVLAGLPVEKVAPTPFQRDLSKAHAERLQHVIDKLDRFLDPVICVRTDEGEYHSPNGAHRIAAVKALGGKSIVSLVIPDRDVMYRILALNTEKAHNLKDKALEVIRMARSLAELGSEKETAYELEFEEPYLLTVGATYEKRARFAGSAYGSVLRRVDAFLDQPLEETLPLRDARADKLLRLDDAVSAAVSALKKKGFDNPYLKNFVVARINPLRFKRGKTTADFESTIDTMLEKAEAFDAGKISKDDLDGAGGGGSGSDDD